MDKDTKEEKGYNNINDPFEDIDKEFEETLKDMDSEGGGVMPTTLDEVIEEDEKVKESRVSKRKVLDWGKLAVEDLRKFLWIILAVLLGGSVIILATIGYNINSYLDNIGNNNVGNVSKYIDDEEYERIKRISDENAKKEERDYEKQIARRDELLEDRRRIEKQKEGKELKEGNAWYLDDEGNVYQDKIRVDERPDDIESKQELQDKVKEDFVNAKLNIIPPRQNVLDELGKTESDINFNNVMLTRGQFVFWLQDTFIYRMSDNGYIVQTYWNDNAKECIVVVNEGDLEGAKAISESLIRTVYNASSYSIGAEDEITIEYRTEY